MIRKDRPYREMMKDFDERLKRIFRDSDDQEPTDCNLGNTVQDDAEKRVEDGFLEITREEMRGVFNPVIQEILRLVQEHIDTVALRSQDRVSVSALPTPVWRKCTLIVTILIFLNVGCYIGRKVWVFSIPAKAVERSRHCHVSEYNQGFATAKSVRYFSLFLDITAANEITLGFTSLNAAVRGAVICGLQKAQIHTRKARRSYGVKCGRTWVHGNPPIYKEWCPFEEENKCRNRMIWYIKKVCRYNWPIN